MVLYKNIYVKLNYYSIIYTFIEKKNNNKSDKLYLKL